MSRLVVTKGAALGLRRCQGFLAKKNPSASKRAAQVIDRHFSLLAANPEIGRPFLDDPHLRELSIAFGNSGYVALYLHEKEEDTIYLLAFRHQKEAGYS